jgi:hypothetical protein
MATIGIVRFDGCDETTGFMLEAKANIDFMFDGSDNLYWWITPEKNPAIQMQSQADAAGAAGRRVVWHAQTEKTYLGLKAIVDGLSLRNLSVEFDPN